MRRLMISMGAAALLVAVTGIATAGPGPRLHGTFDVVATIKDNDFGIPEGTKTNDVYKFKSTCKKGGCAKVTLDRDGGDGSHYKSTLERTAPGVYKGTEGPEPYDCIGNPEATFTADHTIKVTDTDNNNLATKIGGKTNVHIQGCGSLTFVNYKLRGKLR